MLILLCIIWILGACITLKFESVLTRQPTFEAPSRLVIAACIWPIVALLNLTTKHYVGLEYADGTRLQGAESDKWQY